MTLPAAETHQLTTPDGVPITLTRQDADRTDRHPRPLADEPGAPRRAPALDERLKDRLLNIADASGSAQALD